ncbi:hypermethylated in cancer 1 protein-like [Centroberyx affinis]|uniref:hypermethylated in cancer 1 protein-like n=1 Tax=Centroberyx affinis TaxID=166261 RepID=UPI003A5C224D
MTGKKRKTNIPFTATVTRVYSDGTRRTSSLTGTYNGVDEVEVHISAAPCTQEVSGHAVSLLASLNLQRDQAQFCDCVVRQRQSPAQLYPAHRSVLAASSPVLASLLSSTGALVELQAPCLSDSVLPLVLDYIYTGALPTPIGQQQYCSLFTAACHLQMDELQEALRACCGAVPVICHSNKVTMLRPAEAPALPPLHPASQASASIITSAIPQPASPGEGIHKREEGPAEPHPSEEFENISDDEITEPNATFTMPVASDTYDPPDSVVGHSYRGHLHYHCLSQDQPPHPSRERYARGTNQVLLLDISTKPAELLVSHRAGDEDKGVGFGRGGEVEDTVCMPSSVPAHLSTPVHHTYQCSLCDRYFSQRGSLNRHMRSHLGVRPYPCPRCPMTFSRQYRVTEHMRVHQRCAFGEDHQKNPASSL